jgi:hypothetical protein
MALETLKIPAPKISGLWLNVTLSSLRGRTLLLEFWDYTRMSCVRVLPYLKAWRARYHELGLTIIGVHTPEFSFAKNPDAVAYAVNEFGIDYPVLLDSHRDVWLAFENKGWPAIYLIDKDGHVRYRHHGEGSYQEIEVAIQQLLREADPSVQLPALPSTNRSPDHPAEQIQKPTPELYLGYERGALGNDGGYNMERVGHYEFRGMPEEGKFYARGNWLAQPEFIESADGSHNSVLVKYSGTAVNMVMAPAPGRLRTEVVVRQNDAPLILDSATRDTCFQAAGMDDNETYIRLERPRLYFVVDNHRFGTHYLELICRHPGVRLYRLTAIGGAAPKIEERHTPAA